MFRKMRRSNQKLSDGRIKEVLETGRRGALAVQGDDGYPYTLPINFVYMDGKIYMHGSQAGHKADAVKANDKVSFCVFDNETPDEEGVYYYIDSVIVFGRIRVSEDDDERLKALRAIGRKYHTSEEYTENEIRKTISVVNVFVIEPEHITGKHVHES